MILTPHIKLFTDLLTYLLRPTFSAILDAVWTAGCARLSLPVFINATVRPATLDKDVNEVCMCTVSLDDDIVVCFVNVSVSINLKFI